MAETPAPPYVPAHDLLAGKSVLITAAAGAGIGSATARRVAEEGARALTLCDLNERRLGEMQATIEREVGLRPHVLRADVTREADVRALVAFAIEQMGQIDVLVNNAGLGGSASIVDMTDEEWNRVLDVTLTGTFRMTRAVLPHLYERRAGTIVNNASVLGWRAQEEQAHYAAAKAGVMALTRTTAMEAAKYGVRCNAVAPSIAMHEFLRKSAPAELLERLAAGEAFGRAAETWEVANVIVFLASDYASYMTGEVVSVSNRHP